MNTPAVPDIHLSVSGAAAATDAIQAFFEVYASVSGTLPRVKDLLDEKVPQWAEDFSAVRFAHQAGARNPVEITFTFQADPQQRDTLYLVGPTGIVELLEDTAFDAKVRLSTELTDYCSRNGSDGVNVVATPRSLRVGDLEVWRAPAEAAA